MSGLSNLCLAVGLIAPACIVLALPRPIFSIPIGAVVFVMFTAASADPQSGPGIPDWLLVGSMLGLFYVWFFFGCRCLYFFSRRHQTVEAWGQTAMRWWRWVLLLALTSDGTLLTISIGQAFRGNVYWANEVYPVRVGAVLFLISEQAAFCSSRVRSSLSVSAL
jgi:hypothetical protein